MTRSEFSARFQSIRLVRASYRSADTLPPREAVTPPAWHGTLVLGVLLAGQYPDPETITN